MNREKNLRRKINKEENLNLNYFLLRRFRVRLNFIVEFTKRKIGSTITISETV